VSSLFDLPFEEPAPEDVPDPPRQPEPAAAPPPQARPAAPPVVTRRILTVSELTGRIRTLLEREFFEVWIEGELSNCKVWNTGHMYFTLKDGGAQIKGVMFRTALARLRFKPQDGLHVVARAKVTVYDPKGEYQIVCEHLEPEGLGALQLAFDQLKERLQKEGLFDQQRKRTLPALPRKIGVVTSLDGAAIRDIVKVLRRRYANAHIVIRPARVQGDGIVLEEFRGPIEVDAQRAGIELEPAGELVDAVSASATHGAIRLSVPGGSRIDLEAAAQHGEVQVDVPGLVLSRSETERVSGKLGGGGAMVRLTAANGDVRVETPQAVAAQNPQ